MNPVGNGLLNNKKKSIKWEFSNFKVGCNQVKTFLFILRNVNQYYNINK